MYKVLKLKLKNIFNNMFTFRKMEIKIQELEVAYGLVAPRTGHPFQLKARILGIFAFYFKFLAVIIKSSSTSLLKLFLMKIYDVVIMSFGKIITYNSVFLVFLDGSKINNITFY